MALLPGASSCVLGSGLEGRGRFSCSWSIANSPLDAHTFLGPPGSFEGVSFSGTLIRCGDWLIIDCGRPRVQERRLSDALLPFPDDREKMLLRRTILLCRGSRKGCVKQIRSGVKQVVFLVDVYGGETELNPFLSSFPFDVGRLEPASLPFSWTHAPSRKRRYDHSPSRHP